MKISDEDDLIQTYLAPLAADFAGAFGLRDDAALIVCPEDRDLVVTTDPIAEGVHFLPGTRPDDIAWKALAVNLSDLAAKGATPLAYVMTLAFPATPERAWMAAFAAGLAAAQEQFGCVLMGGDTDRTQGPLTIGITAFGSVARGAFVRRQGARAGDHVYVTGTLGDGALGLDLQTSRETGQGSGLGLTDGERSFLVGRYLRPHPRCALSSVLAEYASAALDISDGFLKDLLRLAGGLGLAISFDRLPISPPARKLIAADRRRVARVLSGGDDYEILCAVSPERTAAFESAAAAHDVAVTGIGILEAGREMSIVGPDGSHLAIDRSGYDHFGRA